MSNLPAVSEVALEGELAKPGEGFRYSDKDLSCPPISFNCRCVTNTIIGSTIDGEFDVVDEDQRLIE